MVDDVRVPAGWYPDPLGLPQLRWWDNHAWTEHTSDARQPMVADTTAQQAPTRLAYADDLLSSDELADVGPFEPIFTRPFSERDLPSRRTLRGDARQVHDDDVIRDLAGESGRFAEPLSQLEAPSRGDEVTAEASPAARFAASAGLADAPRSMRYDLDERHEDLIGDSVPRSAFDHASSSSTHFVPDAAFDGLRSGWTSYPAQPESEPAGGRVTGRRSTLIDAPSVSTTPSWLLTLIPVYQLLAGMFALLSAPDASFAGVTVSLVVVIPWILGVVLAGIDSVMLRRNGMERPASWAWAIPGTLVYLVARLVATVREAGTGFGPLLTYLVLVLTYVGAIVAVPGLVMELAPAQFAVEAERSVQQDAASLGVDLAVDCPDNPPLLVQQAFSCSAVDADGDAFEVTVSLQRSNGWIDWRVDDWGVFTLG